MFHVLYDVPRYCCAALKMVPLQIERDRFTWRQMVMLCVTRIPENLKSIQNANNFMEKCITRLSWGEYNSRSLETTEFNIWTDVFSPLCVIM